MEEIRISVRNLVEFILRSGSIDSRHAGRRNAEAMAEGSRMHRKLQKREGGSYIAEMPLLVKVPLEYEGLEFTLSVEGRADGLIENYVPFGEDIDMPEYTMDEIKSTYADVRRISEPNPIHLAQAKCYAYIFGKQNNQETMGIRMTYATIGKEYVKRIHFVFSMKELTEWFEEVTKAYARWGALEINWREKRNRTVKSCEFPFEYRAGQRELVADVYRTIIREKKLFLEAPTGVGKTISTVFPAVKAMGEGKAGKVFYLTAKTIARTVAQEAFSIIASRGVCFRSITLTAKDKICVLEKPSCNPIDCERAQGHFDRVNDCIYDMLIHETGIDQKTVEEYALKHNVCPFEMCLDLTHWADAVICDYNYVFDPTVRLRRFFSDEKKHDYVFLIDESHNLVERAREMFSAVLVKEDVLEVKRLVKIGENNHRIKELVRSLDSLNRAMLALKRETSKLTVYQNDVLHASVVFHVIRLVAAFEAIYKDEIELNGADEATELYFAAKLFMTIYDLYDENYLFYGDFTEKGDFFIKLSCMDPSANIKSCLAFGKASVLFSATLLPISYYMSQLGGTEEDYAVYSPSPFKKEMRLILTADDVSTLYSKRNRTEYRKIAAYIDAFTGAKTGNYMVFFPSYRMINDVAAELSYIEGREILIQKSGMTEKEREEYLAAFESETAVTRIGFCVMGGIFGEGIDLKDDRLIGAVIVGTGIPMVCAEWELFRSYFDERKGTGFEYAYLYPGMNKVLQSAGRVIRTITDRGAILLLDNRFSRRQYSELFPREWNPYGKTDLKRLPEQLKKFWKE